MLEFPRKRSDAENGMDDEKKKQIESTVREEFQMGRARLFRVETERKVQAEIAEDKARVFAAFKQLGSQRELELTQGLARLLMNFSKLTSYRGVLKGYHLFHTGLKLGEDRARFYLVEYLQTHPNADNSELVRYLDRKNGRLSALKTNQNDPLWAWLPRSWNDAIPQPRQKDGEATQSKECAVLVAADHQRAQEASKKQRQNRVQSRRIEPQRPQRPYVSHAQSAIMSTHVRSLPTVAKKADHRGTLPRCRLARRLVASI
jgi:hypothetical protein